MAENKAVGLPTLVLNLSTSVGRFFEIGELSLVLCHLRNRNIGNVGSVEFAYTRLLRLIIYTRPLREVVSSIGPYP